NGTPTLATDAPRSSTSPRPASSVSRRRGRYSSRVNRPAWARCSAEMSSTFSRRSLARYATSTGLPRGPHCEASLIALEYAVHGRAVQTGRTYDNHFVSVITIKDRKVTHWRDYLDPVAVFNAIGWPAR